MSESDESRPEGSVPVIRRPAAVVGETLRLRHVKVSDAEFILSLRLDETKNRHLSETSPEIGEQRRWLEDYFTRQAEVYFIIEELNGQAVGTVRFHDPEGTRVHVGSWVLKPGARVQASIESALLFAEFGFSCLGFKYSLFDVRKGNESVWRFFEEYFGAYRQGETEADWLYVLTHEKYLEARERFRKYLPRAAQVIWQD